MSKFTDVSVVKAANIYFDGKVTSRTVEFGDGTMKTLGLMLPGEYEFGTSQPELMEITAGYLRYKLPGSDQWQEARAGDAFDVPGDARFNVDVKEVTDYVCSYL
jgi:Uncharacterized protein conserved in bacteria